ncbi:MAG: arginine--tRNA ligase, partial [Ignavibacteria bacterium]
MKKYLTTEINSALKKIGIESADLQFDKPKEEKFGDLSANIAMMLAKELKLPPRKIAQDILDNLQIDPAKISKVEIAGAGFLNFFISDNYYRDVLPLIMEAGNDYGRSDLNNGRSANLE